MRRELAISAWAAVPLLFLSPAFGEGWPAYGGDEGGRKWSPASEITAENVSRLAPAWSYRTGHASAPGDVLRRSKFQATPILADGRLLLCTPFNVVIALDPGTGRELWRFDPEADIRQRPGNGYNCRGVALWRDGDAAAGGRCAARVIAATNDRRVFALDLEDGKPCEDFGDRGFVAIEPDFAFAWPGEQQISSAPAVIGDVVIVGSAISDNVSVEAPKGVVTALDARSGAVRWAFDPIPRGAEAVSLGWPAPGGPVIGHANVWAPMSVDAARGLVFLPTSSPSPDFFGGLRPGDNRHANSVVALEAETGTLRWAFQTVHHDVWDYDVPAQPLLATVTIDGAPRDAVIQVTKMGLVFTLDRDTGAPLIPVEERPVPQGGVAGETLSPTQPFPVRPRPLSPSAIAPEDAWGLTPLDRAACAKAIGAARREGLYTPPSLEGTIVFPFTGGGANWGGAAFDPYTERLYVNTSQALHLITLVPREKTDEEYHDVPNGEQAPMRGAPYAMRRQTLLSPLGLPCNPPPWGLLHAVDMRTGEIAWETRLGTTEDLAPLSLALNTGTPNIGGPVVTAGGVVFIAAAMDHYLRAFDAANGRELWSARLPAGGQATPATYVHEGRQYVVVAAGGHRDMGTRKGDHVVAYALPRAGEKAPGPLTRAFDRPGARFLVNVLVAGLVGALALFGLFALVRRLRRR